jgi:hypothetical protein
VIVQVLQFQVVGWVDSSNDSDGYPSIVVDALSITDQNVVVLVILAPERIASRRRLERPVLPGSIVVCLSSLTSILVVEVVTTSDMQLLQRKCLTHR